MIKRLFSLALVMIVLIACQENDQDTQLGLIAENGMVVSAREEASNIGVEIMKRGGNAFDAMIATDLALAVSYPRAGNLGGGGFVVFRLNSGEIGALDYREKAPAAANKDMYLDDQGNVIPGLSTLGGMANGVPGTLAGLFAIYDNYASLPFEELIQPAINLAERGVVLTEYQARTFGRYQEEFLKANQDSILYNQTWQKGDTLKLEALAATLKRIQKNGRDEFYKGETAQMIVAHNNAMGGIMTLEDLASYEAQWREPITFDYRGNRIISMTMPSSGGVCLAEILNAIEPYDVQSLGHNSASYVQLLTEAERRAYADRSYFLGDMDYVEVPIEKLIAKEYAQARMADFSWDRATPSSSIGHGNFTDTESNETTHYSIVDPFGNAVAVTTTLNGNFGSKVFVSDAGFFLNNEMDDFSSKPGVPNMFGLVGAEANAIAPGKRMLSSMTPTIVEKNGALKLVVGSPGGSRIITTVLQNILNVLEFDMNMQESVASARFHHQWLPDMVFMEEGGFDQDVVNLLESKGYDVSKSKGVIIGKVDAILVREDGTYEGGADPRGDDKAAGY